MWIELFFYSYFLLSVGYLFTLSVAGRFFSYKPTRETGRSSFLRIAILIPVYKDDHIIYSSVKSYLQLNYPRSAFDIFVLADSLNVSTLTNLAELPIHIIPVQFEQRTKAKSLNAGFSAITGLYDIALICDGDNILQRNFLNVVNQAFQEGSQAVQGQRVAKNLETSFAVLDSTSESINNHIFRKGANALGLSSSVIGSGMAFQFDLIRDLMTRVHAVGGFDKVLQLLLVERGIKIRYLEDALLFDEKISQPEAFGHQRRRWLSSQFIYLRKYFFRGLSRLGRGNLDYFNLAVLNNIILPRVIILGLLPLAVLATTLLHNHLYLNPEYWWVLLAIYLFSLFLALPRAFFQPRFLRAFLSLPRAIWVMVGSLFRLKGANQTFIHTHHHYQEVNNPIYSDEVL